MPNLTANQINLISEVAMYHNRFRTSAKVQVGIKYQGHHPAVLKSLLARGLIRYVRPESTGWLNPANGSIDFNFHEVELTGSGWDFIYRLDR
jgi:hypothetical protein